VQKDENRIIVHMEADKVKFKQTVMPLIETLAAIRTPTIPFPPPLPPESKATEPGLKREAKDAEGKLDDKAHEAVKKSETPEPPT
jgi:hypothetical protein